MYHFFNERIYIPHLMLFSAINYCDTREFLVFKVPEIEKHMRTTTNAEYQQICEKKLVNANILL